MSEAHLAAAGPAAAAAVQGLLFARLAPLLLLKTVPAAAWLALADAADTDVAAVADDSECAAKDDTDGDDAAVDASSTFLATG